MKSLVIILFAVSVACDSSPSNETATTTATPIDNKVPAGQSTGSGNNQTPPAPVNSNGAPVGMMPAPVIMQPQLQQPGSVNGGMILQPVVSNNAPVGQQPVFYAPSGLSQGQPPAPTTNNVNQPATGMQLNGNNGSPGALIGSAGQMNGNNGSPGGYIGTFSVTNDHSGSNPAPPPPSPKGGQINGNNGSPGGSIGTFQVFNKN